jgi:hypothetical protein
MPEQQKSSWHDDYLKWICSFANAQGEKFLEVNIEHYYMEKEIK